MHMYNEHEQYFSDSFMLGFNVRYFRMLKFLLVLPFVAMVTMLVFVKEFEYSKYSFGGPSLPGSGRII